MSHSQLTTPSRGVTVFMVFLAACVFVDVAAAQERSSLSREARSLEDQLGQMRTRYIQSPQMASAFPGKVRFTDGQVAYYIKDYPRAAILLFGAVDSPDVKGTPSEREALYLLGDSLQRQRNHVAARVYFMRILDLGPGEYFKESATQLLQIAFETSNFDSMGEIQKRVQAQIGGDAGLAYISGKASYREGKFDDARRSLQVAANSPDFRSAAQYLVGVTHVAEGSIDQARAVFSEIGADSKEPLAGRELEIQDLSRLALGRLAYEEGDFATAFDHYQSLSGESGHWDRALWELSWALISEGKLEEARRFVQVFLYTNPDPRLVPEAKLVLADLSLKMDDLDTAGDYYQDVVDEFGPIKVMMEGVVRENGDLKAFFTQMVGDQLRGVERAYFPEVVERWTEVNESTTRTAALVGDIRSLGADVSDTERMLSEIEARLNSESKVQAFPDLEEGVMLGLEMQHRLLTLRDGLLVKEHEVVAPTLGPAAAGGWVELSQELDSLRARHASMPKSKADFQARQVAVGQDFERIRLEADRMQYQIDRMKAELKVLGDRLMTGDLEREVSAAELQEMKALYRDVDAAVAEVVEERRQRLLELSIAETEVGLGDATARSEATIRDRYRELLRKGEGFLRPYRSSVDPGSRTALESIDADRAALLRAGSGLDSYFAELEKTIEMKVADLQKEVAAEYSLLAMHRQSLEELVDSGGAGILAYLNFVRVHKDFRAVVLRGDVGLIDVMWQKKEQMSNKISQLFEDRSGELRALQESFEEVR